MSKRNPVYDFKWCPGCGDFGVKVAIEQALAGIPELRRDTRQILDLEKQRANSVAQAATDRQKEENLRRERERFVQFPQTPGAAAGGTRSTE